MSLNKLALALSLATFGLPLTAFAQEAATTDETPPAETTAEATAEATAETTAEATAEVTAEATTATTAETTAADSAAPDSDKAAPVATEEAEEAGSNLTWNLAVTSDYVFRGITQSNFDPALQGGLDYAFGDSGFYVGLWASNVDFADADGPDIEVDSTIGYSADLAEDWNLDLHFVRYTYLGEREAYGNIDYNEYFAAISYAEMLTFTVAYADDYANGGYSSLYYSLAGSWEVGNAFSLNAGVGHTDFSDDNGSYNDWTVGVSRQFGPVNAAISYFDTNIEGPRVSDSVVLTLALGN